MNRSVKPSSRLRRQAPRNTIEGGPWAALMSDPLLPLSGGERDQVAQRRRAGRAPGPRAGGRARASGRARGRSPRASTARPRSRSGARGSAARAPGARRAPCARPGGEATPRPRRTGRPPRGRRTGRRARPRRRRRPSGSARPTPGRRRAPRRRAGSAGRSPRPARPSSPRGRARPRAGAPPATSFCCRSTTCTGTRIVRAWFATARCTDWRIHQVAYVENLKPRRQSNFSTARFRPSVPSWIRSRNGTPRPR